MIGFIIGGFVGGLLVGLLVYHLHHISIVTDLKDVITQLEANIRK